MKTTLSLIIGILLSVNVFADWTVVPPSPPPVKKDLAPTVMQLESTTIQDEVDHADSVIIEGVPAFNWTNGCTATAAGMLIGYYDRHGFPDLYTGLVNDGVCPLTDTEWSERWGTGTPGRVSFIASQQGVDDQIGLGHIDDYYTYSGTEDDPFHRLGREPRLRPDLLEGDCLADFMGTNQWWTLCDIPYQTEDGYTVNCDGASMYERASSTYIGTVEDYNLTLKASTTFGDATFGIKNYIESKGYIIESYGNQEVHGEEDRGIDYKCEGIFFDNFQEEIDNNRPVIIHLVSHSVLGVGYNATLNIVFIHDTWDNEIHSMEWDGAYGTYVDARGAKLQMIYASFIRMNTSTTNVDISTNLSIDTDLVIPFGNTQVEKEELNTISAANTSIKTFLSWEVTGAVTVADPTALSTTFTATDTGTIQAIYLQDPASIITVIIDSNLSDIDNTFVTPFGTQTVDINTPVVLTATSTETRGFISWEVTGSVTVADSTALSTTFTATADDGNITALYEEIIPPNTEVTISTNLTLANGLVTPTGIQTVQKGQAYTITAQNNSTVLFQNWEVTGDVAVTDNTSSSTTFTATDIGTITANYKQVSALSIKRLSIKVDTATPDRDFIKLTVNHQFGEIETGKLIINDFVYEFENIEWNKTTKINKDEKILSKKVFTITLLRQNLDLFNTKDGLTIQLVINDTIYQTITPHQLLKLSQTWKAKEVTGTNIFIKNFRATYRMSRTLSYFRINITGSEMLVFESAPVFKADTAVWQLITPEDKRGTFHYKENTKSDLTRCNYLLKVISLRNKFTYRLFQKADAANGYRHFEEDQESVVIEFSDGETTSNVTIPCIVKQLIRL